MNRIDCSSANSEDGIEKYVVKKYLESKSRER